MTNQKSRRLSSLLRVAGIICCLLALTLAVTSYSANQYQAYRFIESH